MAVSFPKGNDALLYVSTDWDGTAIGIAGSTWTPLDGFEEYTRQNNANTTNYFFYGRSQAITTIGIPGRQITLSGEYAHDDSGQDILRDYSPDGTNANANLGFMYLRDGTNGYAQLVQVGGGEERSRAEGGLQPVNFTLAPQDEPVPVEGFGS